MFIETVVVGAFRCNCTIVACDATRQAIVVDPGDHPDRILAIIRDRALSVTCILQTHAHLDHVMGAFGVAQATGAPVRLHGGDYALWESVGIMAARHGIPSPPMPPLAGALHDGERIGVGREHIQVIHTPGHTAGSCCFTCERSDDARFLLSGDTLFRGQIGLSIRDGTPTPAARQLMASIRNRLFTLDAETHVLPGHGPATSIGIERTGNPFVRDVSPASRPWQLGGIRPEDETCHTNR